MQNDAGSTNSIATEITKTTIYPSIPEKTKGSSESTFATLFLNSHEIFISWTFVRIHTILRNPLRLPRVELSRAWQFFNGQCMKSWDHLDFDVFTIYTKIVVTHLRSPVSWHSSDLTWSLVWWYYMPSLWYRMPTERGYKGLFLFILNNSIVSTG